MDDQPEVGRPNYSASASRPAPTALGVAASVQEEPRIPIRAALAAFAALLPWAWTVGLVPLPMLVMFLSALLALRLSRRARAASASRLETVMALGAMLAAAVFVFIQLAVTFGQYFVYHGSVGSIIDFYLYTP
ncbi:MAG: hypothetical protein HOW97_11390 [Catenulispora sp.]|nr:hypothetical protein [Catenulispora sp.]